MSARDWVCRYLGEGAASAIERFAAALFGDDQFVECPSCKTPVPANVVSERSHCPKCRASSEKLTTDALIAQRNVWLAAEEAVNNEAAEIERKLSTRQGQ